VNATSFILSFLYPSLVWRINDKKKNIYLTFDDGPIPVITDWVLQLLDQYNAKATFFCIGDNVRKHTDIYRRLLHSQHSIGNHTMNHLNGWKTNNQTYIDNVRECEKFVSTTLFRPPYGKIRMRQIFALKRNYKIVMWDVLSKDYDQSLTGDQCFVRIKNETRNGSIIVFHDSLKAESRLRYALPKTLDYFSKEGFTFKAIP
jgi:peptidoglycan/xylan/chitin deacetylase (PgdA/CDA1 family)